VVGAVLDVTSLHPGRSGRETCRLAAATVGASRQRADELLEMVGLAHAAKQRVRQYSLGMRQRLGIAVAMVGSPSVLVLDEPANGLDPQGVLWLRSLLQDFASEGGSVLISSHLLREVEAVVDRLVIIKNGRLVAQGSMVELSSATLPVLRVETPDPEVAARTLHGLPGIGVIRTDPDGVPGTDSVLRAELVGAAPEDIVSALVGAGVRVRAMVTEKPSLEDLFVSLTGEGFDVGE